jgi:hypothetical protein
MSIAAPIDASPSARQPRPPFSRCDVDAIGM